MAYTMYTPLNVWLDPASVTDVVSYIQNYLSENTIYSEEEIEELIHDYLEAHPELIGGVQSVNGKTGEVVLTASDINTSNNTTIQAVLTALSGQISEIVQTITGLDSRVTANATGITNEATARANADTALGNRITALQGAVGSPLVATTASAMTDTSKIYVYTGSESGYTNGNWYYYNGSAWVSGGVYNATAINTDTTLTVAGMAADAKSTGDGLNDVKSSLNEANSAIAYKGWSLMFGSIYPTLVEPLTYGSTVSFLWSGASTRAFLLFKQNGTATYEIPVPSSLRLDVPNNSNLWVDLTTKSLVVDSSWHYDSTHIFLGRNYFGRLMGGIFTNEFRSVLLSKECLPSLASIRNEIKLNNMFQNDVVLSVGQQPTFTVDSNANITLSFNANIFVSEKLNNSEIYNFSNLSGSYVVPPNTYCVVNMTTASIQILTTTQLFESTDKLAILFFNHYGYPKFGWERYFLLQQTSEKLNDSITPFSYSGEKISVKPTVRYKELGIVSKAYTQGGACYGNYLFQFHAQNAVEDGNFHGCTVVNLVTGKELQFINLGYDLNKHNNNASFGTLKYDANDSFPALYASEEGADARNIQVYRVTETGNASAPFELTAIQTINVPTSQTWNVTYPNACVGDDGFIYIIGYISNNTYEILKFNAPALTNETVQLNIEDVITRANIVINTNAQGFFVNGGKLYISAGNSTFSIMQVNSLTDGSKLSEVTFSNIGLSHEPEALFLFKDIICCTFAYMGGGRIIRFDF